MHDFKWEADNSVPEGRVVYCPDDAVCDDVSLQVGTPLPPACASALPGEELALGAATPRESHQLRMEAVIDKMHKVSTPKWCANYSGGVKSKLSVPRRCTNYSDLYNGAPGTRVSGLETPPQGLGGANAQVVCNSLDMSAQPKIWFNISSLHEITSSTAPREISLEDALNNCGVSPHQGPEVAQRQADLKHANPTIGNLCYQEAASAGSIGHPHSCAQACKYVKRKSGCRDGSQCPNCHLCHWQRAKVAQHPRVTVEQHPGAMTSHGILERTSLSEPMKIDLLQRDNFDFEMTTTSHSGATSSMYSFKWEVDNCVPDGCVAYCPDDVVYDDGGSQVGTPDPPACASASPGEELALGAATPRESHQLRMEAVLDKLHKFSAPKLCTNYCGGVKSKVTVPNSFTDYSDIYNRAPSAKVSSPETQPQVPHRYRRPQ